MKNLFLVSVIIPNFNRADKVRLAINSVLDQTYNNWECLIIEDGSTDNSLNVLESYEAQDNRIKIFKRNRFPKGAPTCRNIGLEKASGELVIFLDSDDYLLPHCLEQRVRCFVENKDCQFLIFPMGIKKNANIIKQNINPEEDHFLKFISADLPWQTMCPIWKRPFLNKLKGFTEGYPRLNDPELMIRALLESESKYKVFNAMPYDCVFIPSSKNESLFNKNVFKSLLLFIPDITRVLTFHNKSGYKNHLALYLHLWFKYFYIPARHKPFCESLKLIAMFSKQRIISLPKSISLFIRVTIFQLSIMFLKKPIDKLSDKSIYISQY